MAQRTFDPSYPEPVHMPGDRVIVVATGAATVVARVVLVRLFGEPVAYAYLADDGRTYGGSEIRLPAREGEECGFSSGRSSGSSSRPA